jgi:nitrile hydratase accessory protein
VRGLDLAAVPGLPRDAEGPVFDAPWQAQAFAMAVTLQERGCFAWREFAARLGAEIAGARGGTEDGRRYYHFWLAALEKLVTDKGLVRADELRQRRDEWARAARETPPGRPIDARRVT